MPKIAHTYTHDFTIIANQLARDSALSYKARGLFLYLWSLPDGWHISLADLQTHSQKDGQSSVRQGVTELQQRGYLSFRRVHAPTGGKFLDTEWNLNDIPSLDFPKMDKPKMDKPKLDKPTLENPITLKDLEILSTKKKDLPPTPSPLTSFASHMQDDTDFPPLDLRSTPETDAAMDALAADHAKTARLNAEEQKHPRQTMGTRDGEKLPGARRSHQATPPTPDTLAVLNHLCHVTGRQYRSPGLIPAILTHGATVADCHLVLDWLHSVRRQTEPDWVAQYLDHTTPFRPDNFDKYLARAQEWERRGRTTSRTPNALAY